MQKSYRCVYPILKENLDARNESYRILAPLLCVSDSGVYRRITGKTAWKLPEIITVCKYLQNNDAEQLFSRRNYD